ncbi:MAG: helix-turn-helix domain-containing protein [Oscillospiraceae bacterium]|nr:helix-turn-helix domain-containing protein [Oscillospiraceae bacterium]
MLGISKSSTYSLLQSNQIRCVRVGRRYIVPKKSVVDFVSGVCYNENQVINGRLNQQSQKGAS